MKQKKTKCIERKCQIFKILNDKNNVKLYKNFIKNKVAKGNG